MNKRAKDVLCSRRGVTITEVTVALVIISIISAVYCNYAVSIETGTCKNSGNVSCIGQ